MKNTILFFSILTLLIFNSCKQDKCEDVNCNTGTCLDGTCNCINGFTGDHCETAPDPCLGVTCQNGGTCVDGTCNCAVGYEGANCEIETRTKYIGTYIGYENKTCSVSGTGSLSNLVSTISAGSTVTEIILHLQGHPAINATIVGNNVTIPSQTIGSSTYSGQGQFFDSATDYIQFSITENDASVPEICVYTISTTKQ